MNEETIQETINSPEFEKEMLESRKKQHDKMVEDLMKQGFTRRNAVRYIKSQSKKMPEKFQKKVKQNAHREKVLIEPPTE